jgi:hypothetical protein
MTQIAGGKYTPSNKFNSLNWTIAMIVAFFIAIGIGRLYALISIINPIIYLNFLLLAGVVILLAIIITLIKSIGKSRNKAIDITTGLIICLTAWGAHWAHIANAELHGGFWPAFLSGPSLMGYAIDFAANRNLAVGRIGSSGMSIDPAILFICYLIEFVAFLAPAYLVVRSKAYYCEDCDNDYATVTGYLSENEIFNQHPSQIWSGDLTFLRNNIFYSGLHALPLNAGEKPGISAIELHYCKKCNANAIVNISEGILKEGDKRKKEMSKVDFLLQDTYITDESRELLAVKMGLFA